VNRTRRVAIVDDSPVAREVLQELLEAEGDIQVVAQAGDGETAERIVAEHAPDLVTMDVEMPGMGGLAAIEQIMARCPAPILVITSLPLGPEGALVFDAVRRGALDVAEKPSGTDPEAGARLRAHVRRLAGLPVVRHVKGLREPMPAATRAPTANVRAARRRGCRVVGIAASAGGPAALVGVLSRLPKDFPACVGVVQHLPVGFAEPFARFLGANTPLPVSVVSARSEYAAGTVLVAGDGRHLVASSRQTFLATDDPPCGGHKPSATVFFRSLAQVFGAEAAGVVLSGIGDDGAAGLVEMHNRGALTISQDEKTSAVFGMPAAAAQANAVERVLSLEEIAPALVRAVSGES
jgi:two-component system, chemotaxis family, protein-glutamate methylesterase/glutaminase